MNAGRGLSPKRAAFLAKYRLLSSTSAIVFGSIITYRAFQLRGSFQIHLLGLALVGLGVYRFWLLLTWRRRIEAKAR